MNEEHDKRRLLRDVLDEGNDAEFRESLLHETLSLAARRRKVRQVRRVASVMVLMGCVGVWLWRGTPPNPIPPALLRAPRAYTLIHTRAFPSTTVVQTEPLPAGRVITSVPTEGIVSTIAAHPGYREIDDRQLFTLAPAPIVLIRHSSNEAEVVFADPANQEEYLRN